MTIWQELRTSSVTAKVVYAVLAGLILCLVGAPLLTVLLSSFQSTVDKIPFSQGVLLTLENYQVLFSTLGCGNSPPILLPSRSFP